MAKSNTTPGWQSAVVTLSGAVVGALIIGALYWAQSIFVPLALAGFLTFVLSPVVQALQRVGLGRTLSVLLVVILTGLGLAAIGSVVAGQFNSLVRELPNYSDNIRQKIRSIQGAGGGAGWSHLQNLLTEIGRELGGPEAQAPAHANQPQEPVPVVVRPESPGLVARLPKFIGPLVDTLGISALAAILVIFMLIRREDMRNRLLRLLGRNQLVETTRAVDDASKRVSRFLLMQAIINGSAGLAIGIGLSIVGVSHSLLWGFLVALMRYVPYLGIWVAAAFPLLLSIATTQGWQQPLEVLGVILVVETIAGNVAEPWLFGQSIGVSEVSLLLSAAFWAFLWGPVGLVLASPMIVCLVVIGKYVPWLQFLEVILADEPALDPKLSFYQRLLANDMEEARKLALSRGRILPAAQVYDEMLLPALRFASRDRQRGELDDSEFKEVCGSVEQILGALREQQADLNQRSGITPPAEGDGSRSLVLACPARDEADRVALEMFKDVLDPTKWEVEVVPVDTLTGEMVAHAAERKPTAVCIGSLPPGGLRHASYLCKRLRKRFPGLYIAVGRWGRAGTGLDYDRRRLREEGASAVSGSLTDTLRDSPAWKPLPFEEPKVGNGRHRKGGASRR